MTEELDFNKMFGEIKGLDKIIAKILKDFQKPEVLDSLRQNKPIFIGLGFNPRSSLPVQQKRIADKKIMPTNVLSGNDFTVVTAQLSGSRFDDILIQLINNQLVKIKTLNPPFYSESILLDKPVKEENHVTIFKNQILEVKFENSLVGRVIDCEKRKEIEK
ncbi:MAG: hypothetical protein ABH821_00575 [archaeon]